MKFKIIFPFFILLLLIIISCNRDEIIFDSPSRELKFSRDTLVLDTVYHQVRSETYALKVYNQEDKDIRISKISLQGGTNSPYRLNVDGKSGTEFLNIPLRKKDSLYIFVEIAPMAHSTEALVEDHINFSTNQQVKLLSVVQDAEFFIKTSTNPNIIKENTVWNNSKAKIIYGELTLAEGKTLTIQKGTKVYFTKNSGLTVSKNAILNVNGDLKKEVVFRGHRNDARHDTIPLNWNSIKIEDNAIANINYAKIFGGTNGLEINNGKVNINNSIIHTFQNFGIKAINSVIVAKNTVMYNCGEATFGIYKGGDVDINHSTLANFWTINSATPALALLASNEWKNENGTLEQSSLSLNIKNSILYTGKDNAILLKPTNGQVFNYFFDSSLIKYDSNAGYQFDNNSMIINSIKNENPKFLNQNLSKTNLRVHQNSPAKGKAKSSNAQSIPLDIMKISRSENPTIGAYQ